MAERPGTAFKGPSRNAVIVGLLLAAMTLAALSPLLQAGFINYDDPVYVTENARVKAGITWDNVRWAFSTTYFGFYYPMTWLSHMLDCTLFGLWAGGHHLTSLILHIASALLLFGLLRRATADLWPSALVAALFAVHPLHVESVAWIAERKDVLSTFFLMVALWAYVEYARRPGLARYIAVLVPFLLGLMSKSMIATAPFLMLLLDYWPLGRLTLDGRAEEVSKSTPGRVSALRAFGRLVAEKAPLFALSAAFVVVTLFAQRSVNAVIALDAMPLDVRAGNALISYGGYLAKMVVPLNLAIFYPYERAAVTPYRVMLGVALLLLISVLCWRARSRRPYALVGWLWYLGVLVPVIGILQVGSQSSADRYTYVALIGIFIALVWSAADLPFKTAGAKKAAGAGAVGLVLVYAGAAWLQARTWHDSVSVARHAVWVTRGNYLAHTLLGTALEEKGDLAGARDSLKAAIRYAPRYVNAWGDLGNLFRRTGELKEAVACYERVLVLDPKDAKSYGNLGLVRELEGKTEEAEAAFSRAVVLAPENPGFRVDLGRIEAQLGKDEDARRNLTEAARLKPSSEKAFYYLGLLDAKEGRASDAEANYRKAMALAPDLPQPRIKLGLLLRAQGRARDAQILFQEALACDPGNAEARALLAGDSPRGPSMPPVKPKG